MAGRLKRTQVAGRGLRARSRTIELADYFNWPRRAPREEWWQALERRVRGEYPKGAQRPWGIPFQLGEGSGPQVILVAEGKPEISIPLSDRASFLCFLHNWEQIPSTIRSADPCEGLVVGEYELLYRDGSRRVQPVRARFETAMAESPGPPWLAVPFNMPTTVDPGVPPSDMQWGMAQHGLYHGFGLPQPPLFVYAMPNPFPGKVMRALTLRGLQESPLLIAGLTLYQGSSHPLRHLPRRTYRVRTPGGPKRLAKAEIDLGGIARIERSTGRRDRRWLQSPYVGLHGIWGRPAVEPARDGEDLIEAFGAEDATLTVMLEEEKRPARFSLGEAFRTGKSNSGRAALEALGRRRQWMQVVVIDGATGNPTPVRIHFSGTGGEYLAPHGHHSRINTNWFEDYGADVVVGGRNFAYVPGEFSMELPIGDVYVEICKGFEYQPVRHKVTIRPGERTLTLAVNRWKDLRREGWVTADTHVHFISPQTAWLEAQAEGLNVVNLLAAQLGRLFTSVGDYTGWVGPTGDDTIVYVGTENRHHMLGHISLLGTKGSPVFPMSCGGPPEAWVADPEFRAMVEWATENRQKGGVVIRPHFPACGHTEDPALIVKGVVDAVELGWDGGNFRAGDFPTQEWYRYLNCGYRVAVVGGTDKMSADVAVGSLRTYAKVDADQPLSYEGWAQAVRAGRTFSTTGPLIELRVEGRDIGDTIQMPAGGGLVEVWATAESFAPLGKLEVVCNGMVVACQEPAEGGRGRAKGATKLQIKEKIRVVRSGWIAARCVGHEPHPAAYMAAHSSPIYVSCGERRAFDGPAAQHMLSLLRGGIEYLQTLATPFDKAAKARMLRIWREAHGELRGRLLSEGHHATEHV